MLCVMAGAYSYRVIEEPRLADVPQADFVDHWVRLTVREHIASGNKLRSRKSAAPIHDHRHAKLVGANSNTKPFCPRKTASSKNRERSIRSYKLRRRNQRSVTKLQRMKLLPSRHSHSKAYQSMLDKQSTNQLKKCPLRIAELAMPSKRRCLAAYSSNTRILPDFMLERLKHYITEQDLLIKVHDAVECFRRHKLASSKTRRNKDTSLADKKKQTREFLKQRELRKLCIQFASQAVARLSTPMKITLVPELQELADIVLNEINKLNKELPIFFYDSTNKTKIQCDISAQVAVWITTVLQDATVRMLEDDIKDTSKDRVTDAFQQRVGNVSKYQRTHQDLEEQEGPALDVLDTIVDNAVSSCFAEPSQSLEVSASVLSVMDETTAVLDKSIEFVSISSDTDEQQTTGPNEFDSDTADKTEDYESSIFGRVTDHTLAESQETEPTDIELNEPSVTEVVEPLEVEQPEFESDVAGDEVNNPLNNNTDENVSDVLLDVHERKVAFVSDGVIREISIDSADNDSRINMQQFVQRINNPPKPTVYPKPDVDLSLPNEELLSDADETWPEERVSLGKAIASVVKSVSSLGPIQEKAKQPLSDNHDLILTEEDFMNIAKDLEPTEEDFINIEKDSVQLPTEKVFINMEKDHINPLEVNEEVTAKLNAEISIEPFCGGLGDESSIKSDLSIKSFKIDINITDAVKSDVASDATFEIENQTVRIEPNLPGEEIRPMRIEADLPKEEIRRSIKPKNKNKKGTGDHNELSKKNMDLPTHHKSASNVKFDYRVHPKTAPAWALRNYSNEEFFTNSKTKRNLNDSQCDELRKWCKQLEKTAKNLEQWNNWLNKACTCILRYKEMINAGFLMPTPKDKAYVENDTRLEKDRSILKELENKHMAWWNQLHKLNQCSAEALKSFRCNSQKTSSNNKAGQGRLTSTTEYCLNCKRIKSPTAKSKPRPMSCNCPCYAGPAIESQCKKSKQGRKNLPATHGQTDRRTY